MAKPTVVLLRQPNGNEVFLNQVEDAELEGGIHCLVYEDKLGTKLFIPEPAVEEWEQFSDSI